MKKNSIKYKLTVSARQLAIAGFALCMIFTFSEKSNAQEVLLDLTANPIIAKKYQETKNSPLKTIPTSINIVSLPFLDDFSKESIYPDSSLWLDSSAFVNRDYPIAPPTLGVATFDGVTKTGLPYDTISVSSISYPADTLTSKPINLFLPASDSVYLSFFWQAKGRGNDPENTDSLVLQFKNPSDTNQATAWKNIWAKNGYNPTSSDTSFRLVMIPITNPIYLQNGFQFRFRNYATVTGNVDHWHIDYVFLDKNRNMGDTIFSDVAFVYNCKSLLKNYQAMPWKQYLASEMKTNLDFYIRNNDTVDKNTSFAYTLFNNTGGTETTYSGGSDNCPPYITNGYWNKAPISTPPIGSSPYSYPSLTDTASFTLECALGTTLNDKDKWNDTLRFKQNFYNYYAYDDGTVESGYGLNYSGGQVAYKFSLNQLDTLVALQILFNWIGPNVNQQQFKIRVWADNGGVPGSMIYEDTISTPNYQYVYHSDWGNLVNIFYPYILKTKQLLSGTFYVGFVQYTNPSTTLLNLGLDKNTNSNSKMFYNVGSGWNQSVLAGSWMMRPVFGTTKGLLTVPDKELEIAWFSAYPNPSYGKFTVSSQQSVIKHAEVFNLYGEMIYQSPILPVVYQSTIDISEQPAGVYLLRITDEKGIIHSQKLILTR